MTYREEYRSKHLSPNSSAIFKIDKIPAPAAQPTQSQSGDQLPPYDDVIDSSSSAPVSSSIPGARNCNGGIISLDPLLSDNPRELYLLIIKEAKLPPDQHVQIRGGKTTCDEDDYRCEFAVEIDLTHSMRSVEDNAEEWYELCVGRDGYG